ncbi:hypothetical protein SO574_07615 [Vibrio alfacsensis]|uniref:hypothetical protein n=1 Tax=Vibrio alfacsensis TaxID=1074311 RepID=UPI002ADD8D66|nr:hypothetical protein [Vibrio alfacsensis]WQE75096.1 hypothetical protein SO574_07615 [Vibrio alfacsensis]
MKTTPYIITLTLLSSVAIADEQTSELQDMSDPLAVYTQAGVGFSNHGINLKYGATYKTGIETQMGMNIFEVKGIAGEQVGWSGSSTRNDSIDSIRFRNFEVDLTNGRGSQIDLNYTTATNNIASEVGTLSYSIIQALPAFGPVNLFPLAGAGIAFGNNLDLEDNGYTIPGTLGVVGMYSKITITDKIWLNYNPMYMSTLSGATWFKDYFFEGDNRVLTHEFTASYQFNPRFNVRYFANWSENIDFADGQHRVEFNYQF